MPPRTLDRETTAPEPPGRLRAAIIGALLGAITGVGAALVLWRPAAARLTAPPSRREIRLLYPTGDFGRDVGRSQRYERIMPPAK